MSLQPFTFPDTGQPVRVVEIDGDPWFVGRDAALILGHANTSEALKYHVPAGHRKGSESLPFSDLGLHPQTVLISEAGLYRLIMRSNTPAAERFQEWVTAEVLPSIRRTGGYGAAPAVPSAPQTYAEALRALADQHEATEVERQRAAALEPDAEYTRRTADADGLRLVGQVAKAWGMQEKQLRQYLYAEGLLIRGGARRNDPTAYAIEREWLVSKSRLAGQPERRTWTTYVTPRGEVGIWRRRYSQGLEDRPHPPSTQLSLVAGGS
ncbi:phage antirepressor [Streptomonospora wellingtoniae]|uniref:BRO family protein n=1 Tax=Streptomonospora wellingtoniae TaxID=3075544 RepID=A0ABU2L0L4_9ACTN|nr:BRO family protein [Streptomonospora sp. DSM 45055]MDT0305095.1 BRO family protein [Streptomonospora sp. DSM 45055]